MSPRKKGPDSLTYTCVGYTPLAYSTEDDYDAYLAFKGRALHGCELQASAEVGYLVPGLIYERREDGERFIVRGGQFHRQYLEALGAELPVPTQGQYQERMF